MSLEEERIAGVFDMDRKQKAALVELAQLSQFFKVMASFLQLLYGSLQV
jgi:nitrate/nitrite-specific signal transduction histidine kinase